MLRIRSGTCRHIGSLKYIFEGIAEEGHYIADRRELYGPDLQSLQSQSGIFCEANRSAAKLDEANRSAAERDAVNALADSMRPAFPARRHIATCFCPAGCVR